MSDRIWKLRGHQFSAGLLRVVAPLQQADLRQGHFDFRQHSHFLSSATTSFAFAEEPSLCDQTGLLLGETSLQLIDSQHTKGLESTSKELLAA